MKAISRRRFLQVAGAAMLVAALPAIGGGKKSKPFHRAVRVRPFSSSQDITRSQQEFYRSARFDCAADAVRALASRGMTGEVYAE